MPRRSRSSVVPVDRPPWCARLWGALCAVYPATIDGETADGTPVYYVRTLMDNGSLLRYTEEQLDPVTRRLQHAWGLDIEAGAFVGPMQQEIFDQNVRVVLYGIAMARQAAQPVQRLPAFQPGRYAHQAGYRART